MQNLYSAGLVGVLQAATAMSQHTLPTNHKQPASHTAGNNIAATLT
jgi:hypothetical protein